MLKSFVKIAAAAAFMAAAIPAAAQIQNVDPNQPDSWEAPAGPARPEAQSSIPEYSPTEFEAATPEATNAAPAPAPIENESLADQTARRDIAVPREDVFNAAEGVFGRGAQGLAHILENILRDQGDPVAYIAGSEAGGAFVFGVRYGSGVMHHQVEGERTVYWTGPSIGFDAGADANKVFVLVYNLHDSQDLFRRYPHAEGHAYFVGGFSAQYMRRGDVVLIPIRLGVGMRLGVNAGYMRFSERNRWLPF